MTQTMTQPEMAAHDEQTYALMQEAWRADAMLTEHRNQMHRAVADRKNRYGWTMGYAEMTQALGRYADKGGRTGDVARRMLAEDVALEEAYSVAAARVDAMEAVYRQAPWARYFPCLNRDGHIHSSMRGCPTVDRGQYLTSMGWATQMSGLTADQAIHGVAGQLKGLGETLCSVCFPEAPAVWCRTRSEVTRAEREQARREREEARYVKRLRDAERFRDEAGRGSWVETVARCKEILRNEVEYRDYYGHGEHPYHAASVTDARKATEVLLAREAANPGTGATEEAIAKIVANAVKSNIRNGARLDPVTGQPTA